MVTNVVIILALLLLAVLLVILELFFLPGLTIAGILALVFYGGALFYAFVFMGVTAGVITLVGAVVITLALIYTFLHSSVIDRMKLTTNIDSKSPALAVDQVQVGDKGMALSRLNPMGTVLMESGVVEARSTGPFIDESTPVCVVKVDGNIIVVESIADVEETE